MPKMDDECATCGKTYGDHYGKFCDPPVSRNPEKPRVFVAVVSR